MPVRTAFQVFFPMKNCSESVFCGYECSVYLTWKKTRNTGRFYHYTVPSCAKHRLIPQNAKARSLRGRRTSQEAFPGIIFIFDFIYSFTTEANSAPSIYAHKYPHVIVQKSTVHKQYIVNG